MYNTRKKNNTPDVLKTKEQCISIFVASFFALSIVGIAIWSYVIINAVIRQLPQVDSTVLLSIAYPLCSALIIALLSIYWGLKSYFAKLRGQSNVNEALKTANRRLNNVIKGAGLATWLYTPEKFYYDATWSALLGAENPQAGEVGIAELMATVHPDDQPRVYGALANQVEGNSPNLEVRLLNANGEWRWHRIIGYIESCDNMGNCLSAPGFTLEVSAQKNLEQSEAALKTLSVALSVTNERMGKLMADAGIHTWEFNTMEDHGLFIMDVQWQRNMGWPDPVSPETLSLDQILALLHPEDRHIKETLFQSNTEGEYLTFEFRIRNYKDEYVWHRTIARIVLVDEQGRSTRFAGMGYDITAQKLLEQSEALLEAQVAQRTAQLEESRNEAQAASQAKSEFLANMSHEIRTPMNGIIGLSYLALQVSGTDPQLRNYIAKIDDSAKALLRIINDILDFSKVSARKLDIEQLPFDLTQTLEHTIQPLIPAITDKGLEILFDFSNDTPNYLIGDATRLRQVIINLVNNAIKFTHTGAIIIGVTTVSQNETETTLRFTVSDSGVGIKPEYTEHLFEAFTQADTSVTRRYGGTGLGLAICKQIVTLMGGDISVKSTVGGGSTFTFTAKFGIAETPEISAGFLYSLTGKKVLVVDNNELSRKILEENLTNFGAEVDCVEEGQTALATFAEHFWQDDPYYAVVIDWKIPGISGLDVAAGIKNITIVNAPPIILLTAYDHERISITIQNTPIDEVLTKPITPSSLHDALLKAALNKGMLQLDGAKHARTTQVCKDATTHEGPCPLAGKRVLLAEDNDINQLIAVELLSSYGLDVTVVITGREAVNAALSEQFDAILMDIQMPEMDGIEATRLIRTQHPALENIPIIAMTAHAMIGDHDKSIMAGMQAHITKPIDPEELYSTLLYFLK